MRIVSQPSPYQLFPIFYILYCLYLGIRVLKVGKFGVWKLAMPSSEHKEARLVEYLKEMLVHQEALERMDPGNDACT